MKGVILAGGEGSRLHPATRVTNKHLLPVYNKPMIYYPILTLQRMGVNDIMIITGGNDAGDFVTLLEEEREFVDIEFTFRYQKGALGIADALMYAKDFVGNDPFPVILGDNIFIDSFADKWKTFVRSDKEGYVFLKEVKHPNRFGVANLDANLQIVNIVEKPVTDPPSNFAVTGLYFYRPQVFSVIPKLTPSSREEMEITDLHNVLAKRKKLGYDVVYGFWSDAGTFESLFNASSFVRGAFGNI